MCLGIIEYSLLPLIRKTEIDVNFPSPSTSFSLAFMFQTQVKKCVVKSKSEEPITNTKEKALSILRISCES